MVNSINYTNLLNTTPETMVDVGHVFFWRMGLETPQKKMDAYLILVGIYALLFLFGGVLDGYMGGWSWLMDHRLG